MPRLNAIDPKEATGKAKELLDGVKACVAQTVVDFPKASLATAQTK